MSLSTETILLIVNIIISSFTTLFLPLFQSISFCIKHIKNIESCGGKIELRESMMQRRKKSTAPTQNNLVTDNINV